MPFPCRSRVSDVVDNCYLRGSPVQVCTRRPYLQATYHGGMGEFRKMPWAALLLAACVMITGCKHSTEEFKVGTQTFAIKGTIMAINAERGEVTLQHDAIPGFMPAMTMPYKLTYGNSISELHPGDVIGARLLVQKTADGDYRGAQLDELAVLAQARPNFKPSSNYHVPTPGDAVPNFRFLNQDGKSIQLRDAKGKALLITFIYTRCPLGDFCPKMSRNFAAIDAALRKDPAVFGRSELLSISFDPVFDTPSVLRAYGAAYTGGKGFDHWQFAAPASDSLVAVEHFFNVGATGSNSTLTHSLSTVLIGPDGKIAEWYPGSEWLPEDVVAKMKAITQTPPGPVHALLRRNDDTSAAPGSPLSSVSISKNEETMHG